MTSNLPDVPAHNLEAEQAVLGSMLLDRDTIPRVLQVLLVGDFYREGHRRIFEVMSSMFQADEPVDLITVTDRLRDKGQLNDAGGAAYVTGLLNSVPIAANIKYYARIVFDKAMQRQEIEAYAVAEHSRRSGASSETVSGNLRAAFDEIAWRKFRARVSQSVGAIDLDSLLSRVVTFITRFIIFASPHQPIAVALWIAQTYTTDAFEVVGYLAIMSAEMRSGKTRLLEILELLVANPWRIVRPTEAVTFRKLAADGPTLLFDEVDTIFRDKGGNFEGIRALLNAGYKRGATVPRVVGEGKAMEVKEFAVFGPKALAGIGDLPDTVADRSIPIRLTRRAPHERVAPFRLRDVRPEGQWLQDQMAKWASQGALLLKSVRPQIPDTLNDRQSEISEPLLAIAEVAGGDWPRLAREAVVALYGSVTQEETLGVTLLRAIREVFTNCKIDRIATADLLKGLIERDDGPWAEWWGRQVAAGDIKGPGHRLWRLLRRFGIRPEHWREGERTVRGYTVGAFTDAFTRYLPTLETAQSAQTEQPNTDAGFDDSLDSSPPSSKNDDSLHPEPSVPSVPCVPCSGGAQGSPSGLRQEDTTLQKAAELFAGEVVEVRKLLSDEEGGHPSR
jgi:hypothetical protein